MLYPTTAHLRDYLSWRQADTHINNLYNTAFWALVDRGGVSRRDAESSLRGTSSAQKNELLFSQFSINYNDDEPMFRKGSILIRSSANESSLVLESTANTGKFEPNQRNMCPRSEHNGTKRAARSIEILHEDIIGPKFWERHEDILAPPDAAPPRIKK